MYHPHRAMLQLGRAEGERSVSQCLVAKALLKVNAIKVNLKHTEEADPRKGSPDAVGCPEFSHARPAYGEKEPSSERAIAKAVLPMVHGYQLAEGHRGERRSVVHSVEAGQGPKAGALQSTKGRSITSGGKDAMKRGEGRGEENARAESSRARS